MTHIMTQKSARVVLSVLFILALACPAAIAELVLHFDANTQEGKDDAWMNSAGPGGAVPHADDKSTSCSPPSVSVRTTDLKIMVWR
jgi:hypothetical protein